MSSRDKASNQTLEKNNEPKTSNKTQEILGTKVNLSFKPIHQQIQEENQKNQESIRNKPSLFPDLEIDEKLLNLLMPNETFTEDDFDYFQHFGARRFEPTHALHDHTKEDIKKFKELRSKVIVKEDSKEPAIFLSKDGSKSDNKKLNIIKLKTKPKEAQEEGKKASPKKDENKNQSLKKSKDEKNKESKVSLVDYSSGEDISEDLLHKKVKTDNKDIA